MRHSFLLVALLVIVGFPAYAEMYKWVDEKGTVHFTDDRSNIPEKYQSNASPGNRRRKSLVLKKKKNDHPFLLLKSLLSRKDLKSPSK